MGDYQTWYDFKKELERKSGRRLLNSDWLSVKPASALPWDSSLLRSSLDRLARLSRACAVPAVQSIVARR